MKNLITLLVLFVAGCSATVEEPGTACPSSVECAWADDNTCTAEGTEYASAEPTLEVIDDGAAVCRVYDATCVPAGTPKGCVPAACHRSIADCQPAGSARTGQP